MREEKNLTLQMGENIQRELLSPDPRLASLNDGYSGAYMRLRDFESAVIDDIYEKTVIKGNNILEVLQGFFSESLLQLLHKNIEDTLTKVLRTSIPIVTSDNTYPEMYKKMTETLLKDKLAAFFLSISGIAAFEDFWLNNQDFLTKFLKSKYENPNNGTKENVVGGIRKNISDIISNLIGLLKGHNRLLKELFTELVDLKGFEIELITIDEKNYIKVKDQTKLNEIKLFLQKELKKVHQLLSIKVENDNLLTISFDLEGI
jgi:hypothetical protein